MLTTLYRLHDCHKECISGLVEREVIFVDDARENHMRQFDTGQYLLSLRNERKVSLAVVAPRLGVSAVYLSEIERGLKLPSDALIRNLSDYYEIDENDLFQRFGKIPLFAREQFRQYPGLQKVLADIGKKQKGISEDQRQKLYDSITGLYKEFLESLEEGD